MPSSSSTALRSSAATLTVALALHACAGELEAPERFRSPAPGDACDVEGAIFASTCAGAECHDSDAPAAGLDLISPGVSSRLAGVASREPGCTGQPLANPADPEASVLFRRLTSTDCGNRMPFLGAPLPPHRLLCVRDYIAGLEVESGANGGGGGSGGAGGGSEGEGGSGAGGGGGAGGSGGAGGG